MGWDGICHLVCVCRVICKLCGMAPLAAVTLWEGGINSKELKEQGVCAKEKNNLNSGIYHVLCTI